MINDHGYSISTKTQMKDIHVLFKKPFEYLYLNHAWVFKSNVSPIFMDGTCLAFLFHAKLATLFYVA